MSPEFILTCYAVILTCILMIAGIFRPTWRIWKYIDVIHYPVAIAGVIFFFIASDNTRAAVRLQIEQSQARAKIARLQDVQPKVDTSHLSGVLLKSSYDLVMTIPELAKACQGSASVDASCMVARRVSPAIEKNLETLN